MTYRMPFIINSTLHNLTKLISNFWMKYLVKTSKYGLCSQEKSLSMPSKNATTHWPLVQTSYLRVTSRESLKITSALPSSLILLIPALI